MELLISARSHEDGVLKSARCTLAGVVTLGRGPESPVMLDGTGISREHLQLHAEGDAIFITDLSSNGTWLNAERLARGKPHPFMPADAIKIPGFEIRVILEGLPRAGGSQERKAPAIVKETSAPHNAGPLERVRVFGASISGVEGLLIVLALATLAFVLLYLLA